MFAGRFKNKVAVVTGGAAGLGFAIAKRIASEGGMLALFDRNKQALESAQQEFQRADLRAEVCEVDVGDEASVEAGYAKVEKQFGRVDILIHSAGIVGPTSTNILKYSAKDFETVCRVNLHGSFLAAKGALARMTKTGAGRLLLIASIAGKEGNPGMCGYSASKAGVIGLVKGIAKEFADTKITVNGLAPAVVQTAMVEACTPEQVKYMASKIPMQRFGTLDETAALSTWIVSDECSFTTGFTFDLTGGRATY